MTWYIVVAVAGWIIILVITCRVSVACDTRRVNTKIDEIQTKVAEVKAEIAALEALTPEDRVWLRDVAGWEWPTVSDVSEPTSYAMPAVGSIWEWDLGNPWGREVVTVQETRGPENGTAGSVWLAGSSGDRWVSLPDFAENAVPSPLGKRR
jgi:hypothetical protein